jgi:trigger factor
VEVDFEVRENGTIIEGGESKNHPLVIGKNNFIPGFEDQLVGMKKGETKEFSLTAPQDFANKDVAGKKLDMKVTIQKIQEVKLPELNDALAQKLGKFDNIDQLILSVKDGLQQEKQEKESQRARLEVIDKLIEGAKLDISEAMIAEQLDVMVKNFDRDLHHHGMELSLYLAKLGKTQDDLRKDWKADAKRQAAMSLVLHAVAREKDIHVAPEEVNAALESMLHSALGSDGTLPQNIDIESLRRNLESRLATEKTLQYLEQTCVS